MTAVSETKPASLTAPRWLTSGEADPAALTPVMRQVIDAKRAHPDALVLFRLGDFYELFFEDALDATRLLDLTLTSRNKNDPRPIPMCGFPYHAVGPHVQRALEAGRRCAIVEQLEDPAQAKGIVQRGVTHVITPGVVLEPESLDQRRAHHLVALSCGPKAGRAGPLLGLAVADVSTGELAVAEVRHPAALAVLLTRLEPRELVLTEHSAAWLAGLTAAQGVPRAQRVQNDPKAGAEVDAALELLRAYLAEVRPRASDWLAEPKRLDKLAHLQLPREAVAHLELLSTARLGRRQGSLLAAVDRTATVGGARALRQLLLAPLADRALLEMRHAAVAALVADRPIRQALRDQLGLGCDVARVATRATAGLALPRELAALRQTLLSLPQLQAILAPLLGQSLELAGLHSDLGGATELCDLLQRALADAPRQLVADGGVIRPGYDAALDEQVQLSENSEQWLVDYEAAQRKETGIASLKVAYNRNSGYGIEILQSKAQQVPIHYHRRQTLKNAERYVTPELAEFERKVQGAEQERLRCEQALYRSILAAVADQRLSLRRIAHALAELDVHSGFAELAAERGWCQPRWVDAPLVWLKGSRHPVLEQTLAHGAFVPNDVVLAGDVADAQACGPLELEAAQLLLITGPNMAGKSTLMRQVALAVILAQAGSFVPAESAVLGVLDGVLTRIGAGDDIADGASTFLVEMRETAEILQRATPRTLVVLDEIGRGTSTWDGLAIAWALIERLHDAAKPLCLCATHYHELTHLAQRLPRLKNAHVAVREWGQEVIFVHRLQPGPTSRSHGVAVARLAGLPQPVVDRARRLLDQFEKSGKRNDLMNALATRQLDLFEGGGEPAAQAAQPEAPATVDPRWQALAERLAGLEVEELSPRQALALLDELVNQARGLKG